MRLHLEIWKIIFVWLITIKWETTLASHLFEQFSPQLRYYKEYAFLDLNSEVRTVEKSRKSPPKIIILEMLVYTL